MSKPASAAKLSPLRILIISPPSPNTRPSLFPTFLHALTGTLPPPDLAEESGNFAGYTSHPPLKLRTKYYEADVGIWCDDVPFPSADGQGNDEGELMTLVSWKEQMLSSAAAEVRAAIGAIVVLLPYEESVFKSSKHSEERPASPGQIHPVYDECLSLLEAINELRETIEDENFDKEIATVAVIQDRGIKTQTAVRQEVISAAAERMEDDLLDKRGVIGWNVFGWDGIASKADKTGGSDPQSSDQSQGTAIDKVMRALELVNWSASVTDGVNVDDDEMLADLLGEDDVLPSSSMAGRTTQAPDGIRLQSHELEREMMGLKLAIQEQEQDEEQGDLQLRFDDDFGDMEAGEDIKVEQLQGLMERVVAIREAGSELEKEERERFARREVARIMREMG